MAGSHWKSAVDPRTNRTYYYHEITRETQWRKPMELASEAERLAMEDKEQKQKDFFAAMEANILNSLSQGQVPGTPNQPLSRRKSSLRPAERPELVRTISTMNDAVLTNLIQRQPSFRNVREGSSRHSRMSDRGFESFVSIMSDKERLDPLQESNDDSMPELFNYADEGFLPDEGSLEGSSAFEDSMRSDGGAFNESSLTGFGLNWEETQALKKLAHITKEMIDAEKEEDDDLEGSAMIGASASATPSWKAKDSKGMRELPREIELEDSDDEDEQEVSDKLAPMPSKSSATPSFQKAKDIGGRELDFEDSDDDDSDGDDDDDDDSEDRPEVKRRNTCGTLFVGTTMSAPDKDATIKCVCGVIRTHILSSEHLPDTDDKDEYRIFNDLEVDQGRSSSRSQKKRKNRSQIPNLDEVTDFYRDIFYKAQMETDCIIMSLIYVERLVKRTGGALRPRADNWRSLVFSCMILSSKVWDDLSMWNADFSQSCPPGVSFPLKRINELELAVLNALGFQVKVPASEYAKYYFLLRSMLIKSGLGGEKLNALDPLDVMGARKMQEVSSQFEHLSLEAKADALVKRTQSLNIAAMQARTPGKTKLGLEQVVKM